MEVVTLKSGAALVAHKGQAWLIDAPKGVGEELQELGIEPTAILLTRTVAPGLRQLPEGLKVLRQIPLRGDGLEAEAHQYPHGWDYVVRDDSGASLLFSQRGDVSGETVKGHDLAVIGNKYRANAFDESVLTRPWPAQSFFLSSKIYSSMSEAPDRLKEMDGAKLSLAQINAIVRQAEGIPEGKVEEPWAVAIANFKKTHHKEGGKWVANKEEQTEKQIPTTCVCPNCGNRDAHKVGRPCNEQDCSECGTPMMADRRTATVSHAASRGVVGGLAGGIKGIPQDQASDSAMVALFLPRLTASAVSLKEDSLPQGTDIVPTDQHHVTLAFLGKVDDLKAPQDVVASVLRDFAAKSQSITGSLNGLGRFANITDGKQAVYANFDSAALAEFRATLLERLAEVGVEQKSEHGFTPHVTLAYVPAGADIDSVPKPQTKITFPRLSLAWGGDVEHFELGGSVEKSFEAALTLLKGFYPEADPAKPGALSVFKDDGCWRWASITSATVWDKQNELVTRKAMDYALAYAHLTGQKGPLRHEHIPGLDCGECDWQMRKGGFLFESGFFYDNPFAQRCRETYQGNPDYQISAGLRYRLGDIEDGVYKRMVIFERSPTKTPAVPLTALGVRKHMIQVTDEMLKQVADELQWPIEELRTMVDQTMKSDDPPGDLESLKSALVENQTNGAIDQLLENLPEAHKAALYQKLAAGRDPAGSGVEPATDGDTEKTDFAALKVTIEGLTTQQAETNKAIMALAEALKGGGATQNVQEALEQFMAQLPRREAAEFMVDKSAGAGGGPTLQTIQSQLNEMAKKLEQGATSPTNFDYNAFTSQRLNQERR